MLKSILLHSCAVVTHSKYQRTLSHYIIVISHGPHVRYVVQATVTQTRTTQHIWVSCEKVLLLVILVLYSYLVYAHKTLITNRHIISSNNEIIVS